VATGSCVIRWTTELLNLTQASDNDSTTQRAFKEALHTAFENRIAKYITTVTNMLKASLFDTRESGKLESYGVKPNLILDAWKTILDEGLKLFDVKDGHDDKYKRLLKSSLDIVGEAIRSSDIKDRSSPVLSVNGPWWQNNRPTSFFCGGANPSNCCYVPL